MKLILSYKCLICNHSDCNKWVFSGFSAAVLKKQQLHVVMITGYLFSVKQPQYKLVLLNQSILNSMMILHKVSLRAIVLKPSHVSMYYPYRLDNQRELPFCFHCTAWKCGWWFRGTEPDHIHTFPSLTSRLVLRWKHVSIKFGNPFNIWLCSQS